jgi:hypothetical protein
MYDMKKTLPFFIAMLIAISSFTGCNKDSDEKGNYLSVGGTRVVLDTMGLYYNGSYTYGYLYYVDIVSPGIVLDDEGYFSNSGSFIEFVVVSSSDTGLDSGEYEFVEADDYETDLLEFNYNSCQCLNWVSGGSNTYIYLTSGALSITRDGSNYEISFSGKDENNKTVKAYYKGKGLFYDFSKKKSTATSGRF